MTRRVLILGGTAEAVSLARALGGDRRFEPILSLAGRTREAVSVGTATRVGGFGGAEGLAVFLADERIDRLIDATHPFAARISANAMLAAESAGVSRLAIVRPPWGAVEGDDWHAVGDEAQAASAVPAGARAFLALGSQHLGAFAVRKDVWWLVRVVDPPEAPLLPGGHLTITGRGPFVLAGERTLLESHRISHLVARNSGGEGARAKIDAARDLGVPVLMIARPPAPPGPAVDGVAEALDWLIAGLA